MTTNRIRLTSTLASSLPAAGKLLSNIYPTPTQLGESAHSTYDAYWGAIDAMLLDDEIAGDLELRKSVALSMPWLWIGSDVAISNIELLLAHIDFDELLKSSLSHLEYGFNPIEIEWFQDGAFVVPKSISRRTPRLFRIRQDGKLLYTANAWQPVPVAQGKVMIVTRNASRDKPYGESLLEPAWPTWQVKWNHIANLDRLGEKYAVPSVVALSKTMTDQAKLDVVSESLAALESGAGVALGGVDSIIKLDTNGKATELVDVIKHYDDKLCKLITGQTLSTGNSAHGSRALGEVFERATLRLCASDLKVVFRTLNLTLLRWLKELNPTLELPTLSFDEAAYQVMLGQASTKPNSNTVTLSHAPDESLLLCL